MTQAKAYIAQRAHPMVAIDAAVVEALAAREVAGKNIRHDLKLYRLMQLGDVNALHKELSL